MPLILDSTTRKNITFTHSMVTWWPGELDNTLSQPVTTDPSFFQDQLSLHPVDSLPIGSETTSETGSIWDTLFQVSWTWTCLVFLMQVRTYAVSLVRNATMRCAWDGSNSLLSTHSLEPTKIWHTKISQATTLSHSLSVVNTKMMLEPPCLIDTST